MPGKGFIDVQANGYRGVSYASPVLELDQIRAINKTYIKNGVAAYCPTLVTSPLEDYEKSLPVLAKAAKESDLKSRILGFHIEGPFLAGLSRGAHTVECFMDPDPDVFDRWQELAEGNICIITMAPERDGAPEFIRHVTAKGVVVSLGHHMGDRESIDAAVDAGATLSTHLGNGISNVLPRHPNPIWSQMANDSLYSTIITDGFHLPDEFIKVAWRAKGVERFIVVSDVSPVAGLEPGLHTFMDHQVVVSASGKIELANGEALAGSGLLMLPCMNYLVSLNLLTEEELWRVGRYNALKLLGRDESEIDDSGAEVVFENGSFAKQ